MVSKLVKVNEIMQRAREAADMQSTNFITDNELIRYISSEYTELYDLLVSRYQLYYANPTPFIIQQDGNEMYDLPTDFYKLAGIERMDSVNAPNGQFTTLYPFNFTERNIITSFNLFTQRYCIVGDKIMFKGGSHNSIIRVWYMPAPQDLSILLNLDSVDYTTSTLTLTDHGFKVGDYVYFKGVNLPAGIVASQKYWVVNPTTDTFQVSLIEDDTPISFTSNGSGVLKVDWYGSGQSIDGVSGWEEIIVVGAAIRMLDKEESSTTSLVKRKNELFKRIEAMAQARDVGNAPSVTDVRTIAQELEYPFLFRY